MHMKKITTLNLNILHVEESFGYLKLVSAETPLLNPGGGGDRRKLNQPADSPPIEEKKEENALKNIVFLCCFDASTFVNLSLVRGVTINFHYFSTLPLLPLKHEILTYPHLFRHTLHLQYKIERESK